MQRVILFILDGLAVAPSHETNYLYAAATPYFDYIAQTYPMGLLSVPSRADEGHELLGNGLSGVLATLGKRQEKWFDPVQLPLATYFFNGKQHESYTGETWRAFPSTIKLLQAPAAALPKCEAEFVLLSCAWPGEFIRGSTAKEAVFMFEKLDRVVHTSIDIMLACGSTVLITSSYADLGKVPVMLLSKEFEGKHFKGGREGAPITHDWHSLPVLGTLSDIAPTILKLMGLEKPRDMQGNTLL